MEVLWHGQHFTLMRERAAYWHQAEALVVADVHLGKAAAFRAAGVPVPEAVTQADLIRLGTAIDACNARRLIVLGDLLHAASGRKRETMEAFETWRRAREGLEIVLVRGNHDHSAGDPPGAWRIRVIGGREGACEAGIEGVGGVVLAHEPTRVEGRGVLCGHLHPAVRLVDAGRAGAMGASVRLACFWFGRDVAVWPAFGGFTGCALVKPTEGDRVFGIGPEGVFEAAMRAIDQERRVGVAGPSRLKAARSGLNAKDAKGSKTLKRVAVAEPAESMEIGCSSPRPPRSPQ